MSKKKVYNPPPQAKPTKIPTTFNKYVLLNPAFPVETAYQILSHTAKEAMFMIRGTEDDFKDNPNDVFRIINEPISLKGDTDGQ